LIDETSNARPWFQLQGEPRSSARKREGSIADVLG